MPTCPKCGKEIDGHPAVSREDNKTLICSACGQHEALLEFYEYMERKKNNYF